jgi:hypothetical protein
MNNNCCEKCGKELGFFSRNHGIDNDRIGIHYDALCSTCYQSLKHGIDQIDVMSKYMMNRLKKDYGVDNMAAVDVDTLIYLAVEAVLTTEPDYGKESSDLHQAIINRKERAANPMDDMAIIVERIIDHGFSINKKNAQIIDFRGYFDHTTLYLEQVGLNLHDDVPKSYCCVFFCCRGILALNMENKQIIGFPVAEDTEIKYIMRQEDGRWQIILDSITYAGESSKNVILYPVDENQTKDIIHTFDRFNDVTRRRRERRKRDTQTIITRNVIRDVKRVKPDEVMEKVSLDCVLICLAKNMLSDEEGRKSDFYAPDGLAVDILFANFEANLKALGLTNREDLVEFMKKNTLLSQGFNVRYEEAREPAWAFFTTKGYILCFVKSRKFVYVFEDCFPNDVYYPCNDLIYKGTRFLQLAEERPAKEASGDYRTFDGMIFYSDDIDLIGQMNRFFTLNNIFYVMDKYIETETQIYRDRDSLMEVKRISDRMFWDFSYLPFCLYDEWAAIREKMKEDDFLLRQLIDEKTGGHDVHPSGETTYTIRIMDAFNRGARELNNSLKLGDLSVAKGILWGYFNESLVDTLSREWIRIAGDIVREGDSLEDAFSKYFNMADIESDKAYYLGLYVYYLMYKMVLPADGFLENYNRCLPVYLNFNKKIRAEEDEAAQVPVIDLETADEDQAESQPETEASAVIAAEEDTKAPEPAEKIKAPETEESPAAKTDEAPAEEETSAEPVQEAPQEEQILIKDAAEILAERAAEEARIEKPIHRVIGEGDTGEDPHKEGDA